MDTQPPSSPPTPPSSPESESHPPNAQEKQWKLILHLSALVGAVIPFGGNVIAPLVVWLIKKVEIPALETEGRKVLNFQISYLIYMLAAALVFSVTSCLMVTALLPIAVGIAWLIFTIIGAIKVSNDEPYTFPLSLKLL